MLNSLKRYVKFKKPFYGINCGTFGFLLNKFSFNSLEKKIINFKKITINPLKITSIDTNNKKKTCNYANGTTSTPINLYCFAFNFSLA